MSNLKAAARSSLEGVAEFAVSRDPLRLLVAGLLFLTVSRAHQHYRWLGALHPGDVLFVGALGLAMVQRGSLVTGNLTSTWIPRVMWGLGMLAAVSVPFALSMGTAGGYFTRAVMKMLVVVGLVLVTVRHPGDLKLYLWTYVLACGFLVFLSVSVFSLQQAGSMYRLSSLYMYDSNGLGLVLSTGLPLCFVLFQNSEKVGKVTTGLIVMGIGVSLARSGSRGGLLGLLAVGLMLLIVVRGVSIPKRIGFLSIVAAGLLVASPPGYWQQMETLTEPTEDYNWTNPYGRKAVTERGLGYMLDNPLTGVGIGNFPRAEGLIAEVSQKRRATGRGYRWTAAHNSWVQVGAELGIPGFILFCVLIFGSALGMYRLRKRLPRGWRSAGGTPGLLYDLALYLPVSFVGFAVTATFLSFAYHAIPYLLAVFAACTYIGVRQLARHQTAGHHSSSAARHVARVRR